MDFGKVKILLIVVFLGLNVFLARQWLVLGSSVSIYTEPFSDQLANIQRTFAEHGINMDAQLPGNPSTLPMTMVSLSPAWFTSVAELSISASKKSASRAPFQVHTSLGRAEWVPPDQVRITFDRNQAVEVMKQGEHLDGLHKWLLRHVYNFIDYQLLSTHLSHQTGVVKYVETVNNLGIYSAPLVVVIEHGKIIRIMQTYVGIGKSIYPRTVMSAANALLALASNMDKAQLEVDNTIKDMQLGYSSGISTGSTGYLSPVWRIASTRGFFYVNALNGEVSVQNQ